MREKPLHNTDHTSRHILWAALLLPIALFPFGALLSYDWHAVAVLNVPPEPSTNWIGALGDAFAYYGYILFGLGVWLVPIFCLSAGIRHFTGFKVGQLRRILWRLVILLTASCLLQTLSNHTPFLTALTERVNAPSPGGLVGYLLMTRGLAPLVSDFGSSVIMVIVLLIAVIALIGAKVLADGVIRLLKWATEKKEPTDAGEELVAEEPREQARGPVPFAEEPLQPVISAREQALEAARAARAEARRIREEEKAAARAAKLAEKETRKAEKAESLAHGEESPPDETRGPYILPPLSLLNPLQKSTADHGDVNEMSKRLIDTLNLFGINATLSYTVRGPVVTKYALLLAPGTRYATVRQISDNLMGALHARSLRIETPIPGEECVGIEVPNRTPAGISFREIIESETWKSFRGELPLLFGKDAAGRELVADLAKMPHMLVAGATGQGKSVCLNAIINGLLMNKTPDDLKLIMVDPKSVEFSAYAALPHLLVPVITENRKVVFSLHWAVAEMEKRLKMFARARVKNIYDFNHRPTFTQTDMFGESTQVGADLPRTVPYIIIIIDEVADLMAQCGKDVTPDIARLTAKARAAGIHLILATQRPDARIIQGPIKANVPGRVAFKTASAIDSRTILDTAGAEDLIGRGDMLFRAAEGQLIRAQGAWIADEEITRVTQFIEQHTPTQFDKKFADKLALVKEADNTDPFASNENDPENQPKSDEDKAAEREQVKAEESASDFKKAIECVINTNRASISHFQRRLGWGYNHSAKIMDMLEDAGVIGPQVGAGPRSIIMDQQQLMAIFNGNAPNDAGAAAGAPDSLAVETDNLFSQDNQEITT